MCTSNLELVEVDSTIIYIYIYINIAIDVTYCIINNNYYNTCTLGVWLCCLLYVLNDRV